MDEKHLALNYCKLGERNKNIKSPEAERVPFKNISNCSLNFGQGELAQGKNERVSSQLKDEVMVENSEDSWHERTEVITKQIHQNYLLYSNEMLDDLMTKAVDKSDHVENLFPATESDNINQTNVPGLLRRENSSTFEPALALLKSFENLGVSSPATRKVTCERVKETKLHFNPFLYKGENVGKTGILSNKIVDEKSLCSSNVPNRNNFNNCQSLCNISPSSQCISSNIATKIQDATLTCKQINSNLEAKSFESNLKRSDSNILAVAQNSLFEPKLKDNSGSNLLAKIEAKLKEINVHSHQVDDNEANSCQQQALVEDSNLESSETYFQSLDNNVSTEKKSFECGNPVLKAVSLITPFLSEKLDLADDKEINEESTFYDAVCLPEEIIKPLKELDFIKNNIENSCSLESNVQVDVENLSNTVDLKNNSDCEMVLDDGSIDQFATKSYFENIPIKSVTNDKTLLESTLVEDTDVNLLDSSGCSFTSKSAVRNSSCKDDFDVIVLDSSCHSSVGDISSNSDSEIEILESTMVENVKKAIEFSTDADGQQTIRPSSCKHDSIVPSDVDIKFIDSNVRSSSYNLGTDDEILELASNASIDSKLFNSSTCYFTSKSSVQITPSKDNIENSNLASLGKQGHVVIPKTICKLDSEVEIFKSPVVGNILESNTDTFVKSITKNSPIKFETKVTSNSTLTSDIEVVLIESCIDPFATKSTVQNTPFKIITEDKITESAMVEKFEANLGDSRIRVFYNKSTVQNCSSNNDSAVIVLESSSDCKLMPNDNKTYNLDSMCNLDANVELLETVTSENDSKIAVLSSDALFNNDTIPNSHNQPDSKVDTLKLSVTFDIEKMLIDSSIDPYTTKSTVQNSPCKIGTEDKLAESALVVDSKTILLDSSISTSKVNVQNSTSKNDSTFSTDTEVKFVKSTPLENSAKVNDSITDADIDKQEFQYSHNQFDSKFTKDIDQILIESSIDSVTTKAAARYSPAKPFFKVDMSRPSDSEKIMIDSTIDAFTTKSVVHNSPTKSVLKDTLTSTASSDIEKMINESGNIPFGPKSAIQNFPSKPGSKVDIFTSTVSSDIEKMMNDSDIDPFSSKCSVHNSLSKPETKVDMLTSTVYSDIELMMNVSDIDPFASKSAVQNSPSKPESKVDMLTSAVSSDIEKMVNDSDIDPFACKSAVQSSPWKPKSKVDMLISTVSSDIDKMLIEGNIDPFITKSAVQNSPAKPFSKADMPTPSDSGKIMIDSSNDAFAAKSAVHNSPTNSVLKDTLTVSSDIEKMMNDSDIDPFACKSAVQNSPFKLESKVDTSTVSSDIEKMMNDGDIGTFACKSTVQNSQFKPESKVDTSTSTVSSDIEKMMNEGGNDPFASKSAIQNSPSKPESKVELLASELFSDIEKMINDSDIFSCKSAVQSSPFKPESKVDMLTSTVSSDIDKILIEGNIDSFTSKPAVRNSPFKPESKVDMLTSTVSSDIDKILIEGNIDPFTTKSAVLNSPSKPESKVDMLISAVSSDIEKMMNDSDIDPFACKSAVQNSPFKPESKVDMLTSTVSSDIEKMMNDSDIDPFACKSAVQNSPFKQESKVDMLTSTVSLDIEKVMNESDNDPFASKSAIKNSPSKPESKVELLTSEVFSDIEKMMNDSDIDPLACKSAVQSSPFKPESKVDMLTSTVSSDIEKILIEGNMDPFTTKSAVRNSPFKPESKVDMLTSTVSSDIDKILIEGNIDPFTTKSAVLNSPSKPESKVDMLISAVSSDIEKMLNDSDIDPFACKSTVQNSPFKPESKVDMLTSTVSSDIEKMMNDSDIDPFACKSTVQNSPFKPKSKVDTLTSTVSLDMEKVMNEGDNDPFASKSDVQNSPFMPESKVDILRSDIELMVNDSDIDPLTFKSAVKNSPLKPETKTDMLSSTVSSDIDKMLIECNIDPFTAKSTVQNSLFKPESKVDTLTSTVSSDIEKRMNEGDNDPFVSKSPVQNSPSKPVSKVDMLTSAVSSDIEKLMNDSSIDPFTSKSAVQNSPSKSVSKDMLTSTVSSDIEKMLAEIIIDPFTTKSAVNNSPFKLGSDRIECESPLVLDTDAISLDTSISAFNTKAGIHNSPYKCDSTVTDSSFVNSPFLLNSEKVSNLSEITDMESKTDYFRVSASSTNFSSDFVEVTDFESNLQEAEFDKLEEENNRLPPKFRQSISSMEFDAIAIEAVELASEVSFKKCDDIVPAKADSEEFSDANDFFCNNEELDELSSHGIDGDKKNLIRNSLFVKFDPLVAGRMSLAHFLEKEKNESLDPRRGSALIYFSPAKKTPTLSSTLNATSLQNEAMDQTLVRIDDSALFDRTTLDDTAIMNANITYLNETSSFFGSRSMSQNNEPSVISIEVQTEENMISAQEFQASLRNQELAHQGVLLRKSQDFEKMQKNFKEELLLKDAALDSLTEEKGKLKKTSVQLLSLLQQMKEKKAKMEEEYIEKMRVLLDKNIEEVNKLKEENQQKQEELMQSENSLFDFFKKYDRMREVVETLHRNEEVLKKENEELRLEIVEKTEGFKSAFAVMENQNKEVSKKCEDMEKAHLNEINKAALLFKRAEMKIFSLTEDVAKKNDEIKHITNLLDEFSQKFN